MLRLQTVFEAEGLDPTGIQLVRHKDRRFRREGRTIFDVWFSDRERFENYQRIQSRKYAFDEGGLVASFVVSNSDETLFVGCYYVEARRFWTENDWCDPLWDPPSEGRDFIHELRLTEHMSDYVRRLVIKPWRDPINFVKRAKKCDPEVLEIKKSPDEEQFPSYISFRRQVNDLRVMFPAWTTRLREARGVYLLTFDDGMQYVGSATGELGFWQRWETYLRNGNGGNQVLIRDNRDAREAVVSILEVSGSASTRRQIFAQEMIWKGKLGPKAKPLDTE